MGDGARDGFAECKFSVRSGPRNGLVDGVNATADSDERMLMSDYPKLWTACVCGGGNAFRGELVE